MATSYIAYSGSRVKGTWKEVNQRFSCTSRPLQHHLTQNTAGLSHLSYCHEEDRVSLTRRSPNQTSSRGRGLRIALWFLGFLAVLYAWNGFVSAQTTTVAYQVKAGDTLWSVAQRHFPNRDPRGVTVEIERLNHISGTDNIYPGEVLQLPRKA